METLLRAGLSNAAAATVMATVVAYCRAHSLDGRRSSTGSGCWS